MSKTRLPEPNRAAGPLSETKSGCLSLELVTPRPIRDAPEGCTSKCIPLESLHTPHFLNKYPNWYKRSNNQHNRTNAKSSFTVTSDRKEWGRQTRTDRQTDRNPRNLMGTVRNGNDVLCESISTVAQYISNNSKNNLLSWAYIYIYIYI